MLYPPGQSAWKSYISTCGQFNLQDMTFKLSFVWACWSGCRLVGHPLKGPPASCKIVGGLVSIRWLQPAALCEGFSLERLHVRVRILYLFVICLLCTVNTAPKGLPWSLAGACVEIAEGANASQSHQMFRGPPKSPWCRSAALLSPFPSRVRSTAELTRHTKRPQHELIYTMLYSACCTIM